MNKILNVAALIGKMLNTQQRLAVCMNECVCVKEAERMNEILSYFSHIKGIQPKAIKMEERLIMLNIQRNKRRSNGKRSLHIMIRRCIGVKIHNLYLFLERKQNNEYVKYFT